MFDCSPLTFLVQTASFYFNLGHPEITVKNNLWDTTEYAMAFQSCEWLYSSQHEINKYICFYEQVDA